MVAAGGTGIRLPLVSAHGERFPFNLAIFGCILWAHARCTGTTAKDCITLLAGTLPLIILNYLYWCGLRLHVAADLGLRLALSLEHGIEQIVRDVQILLLLVLEKQALQLIECLSEALYDLVGQEAVLRRVVVLVQRVQDHEVRLRRSVLVE